MGLLDKLKKQKKLLIGMALGGTLIGGKQAVENFNSHDAEPQKVDLTNTSHNKSEIRQKIAYLDEYVAAVESGKDKEKAYYDFALKMADGDTQKMAEMQRQLNKMQQKQTFADGLLLLCLAMGAFLIYKNDFKFDCHFASKPKSSSSKKSDEIYKRSNIGFHTKD